METGSRWGERRGIKMGRKVSAHQAARETGSAAGIMIALSREHQSERWL